METRVVTAHLPADLAAQVDAHAERLERSRGWIVKQALADWVAWEDEKERRTLEGLADIDAGRLIPHEEVVAWAKSLGTDHPLPRPRPPTK
jgi:predicted transcriptional regulator